MSATCPACGVAVVPGYVRCPKCHLTLPGARRTPTVAGGTTVEGGGRGLPIVPLAGASVVVLGIVLYVAVGKSPEAPAPDEPSPLLAPDEPITEQPEELAATAPSPQPRPVPGTNNRVDPRVTAKDLERALKNMRLWSLVDVADAVVVIRSSACRDANMNPMVDAARNALRNAGLTRVRCLENSGAVVFERDL